MNTNSSYVIYAYLILRHHPGQRCVVCRIRFVCFVALKQCVRVWTYFRIWRVLFCTVSLKFIVSQFKVTYWYAHFTKYYYLWTFALTVAEYIICYILVWIIRILYMKYAVNTLDYYECMPIKSLKLFRFGIIKPVCVCMCRWIWFSARTHLSTLFSMKHLNTGISEHTLSHTNAQ